MDTLIFQLQGPLSSWGETAVGEYRPSAAYPSQSAILGLLAAALGITRDDETALAALAGSVRLAIGVLAEGRLLRDYHTAQVSSRSDLKKRPRATRRDELALPKYDLNTILSTRDYRQDAAALVAVQLLECATHTLAQLAEALRRPKFVLYLGRKSCPLGLPAHPCVIDADNVHAALVRYQQALAARWADSPCPKAAPAPLTLKKITWGDNFGAHGDAAIGLPRDLSVTRKDAVLARSGWQFGDRREHIALLEEE